MDCPVEHKLVQLMRCMPGETTGTGSAQQDRKHQDMGPKQEGNDYSRDEPGGTERSRLNAYADRALVVREQQVGKTPHAERPNRDARIAAGSHHQCHPRQRQ
jgi:hypothetical protein